MKKIIYIFVIALLVAGGWVYANRNEAAETTVQSVSKPISESERKAAIKEWEATPEGAKFRNWEASPAGRRVRTSAIKVMKSITDFSNMEAVVTSITLPKGARLGYGFMVNIKGETYIVSFGPEILGKNNPEGKIALEKLRALKVNDKIILKSHNISQAPKYAYPIVAGDYIEHKGEILYKRISRQGGC